MENIESINNIYSLIAVIIFLLIGSGGAIWKIIETIQTKKVRTNLNMKLSQIDLSQNEQIGFINLKIEELDKNNEIIFTELKDLRQSVEEFLIISKIEILKTDLNKQMKTELHNFIVDNGIKNDEIEILLNNAMKFNFDLFSDLLREGLENVNLEGLRNQIYAKLQSNNFNLKKNLKEKLHDIIVTSTITTFIEEFKFLQKLYTNGKLLKEFYNLILDITKKMIPQIYKIYISV